jgi:hypothetical protein
MLRVIYREWILFGHNPHFNPLQPQPMRKVPVPECSEGTGTARPPERHNVHSSSRCSSSVHPTTRSLVYSFPARVFIPRSLTYFISFHLLLHVVTHSHLGHALPPSASSTSATPHSSAAPYSSLGGQPARPQLSQVLPPRPSTQLPEPRNCSSALATSYRLAASCVIISLSILFIRNAYLQHAWKTLPITALNGTCSSRCSCVIPVAHYSAQCSQNCQTASSSNRPLLPAMSNLLRLDPLLKVLLNQTWMHSSTSLSGRLYKQGYASWRLRRPYIV